jgi:hypothetical protein
MSKRTSYDKIYHLDVRGRPPDICARPRLSRAQVFIVCADGKKMRLRGQATASAQTQERPRGHRGVRFTSLPLTLPLTPSLALCGRLKKKKKKFFFFLVVAC